MAHNLGMEYHAIHFSREGESSLPQLPTEAKVCLVTNTHTPVEKIPSQILDQTIIMLHANSGYDNFPPKWAKAQDFPIILGNSIRAQAVTQYIVSELLSYSNQVDSHKKWDATRKWPRQLLDQKKVLIIGYGEIGHKLESTLLPLTQEITIYDPFQERNFDLNSILGIFDIIIFSCSLNKSSHHLLNQNNIDLLKEDVLIINAARGRLIEEKPLISFLSKNPSAYAILDVFEKEPFTDQFNEIQNIKTTSHIAGVSKDLDQRIVKFAQTSLKKMKNNEELSPTLQNRYVSYQGQGILI